MRSAIAKPTAGCTMLLSAVRASSSRNTMAAKAGRSRVPSAATTPLPNRSTIASYAGVPGSTTSRASTSASRITAPRASSMRDTVDFPDPIPPVRPTVLIGGRPYHAIIDLDPLHASRPDRRLRAAQALREKDRRTVLRRAQGWPNHSPGAVNAWLLLFTRKPPSWEDPLLPWTDESPTLGEPHPGFFYPDPT